MVGVVTSPDLCTLLLFVIAQSFQVALFSATMPLEVLDVTNRFMPDPVRILVKKDELTLEGEKTLAA